MVVHPSLVAKHVCRLQMPLCLMPTVHHRVWVWQSQQATATPDHCAERIPDRGAGQPKTESGKKHVVVFQEYLTKWPLVFPVPDQKAVRIAQLLAEKVVPVFGVPESLLTDRGTNLFSHLIRNFVLLGTKKLNTTTYHPWMVERFNRTLKTILEEHAAKFGAQWD